VLDRDVLAIVNERLPVSTLQRLAAHPRVPPNVRRELLQMIFVRLWLLDRLDGLRGVLPEVRASEPGLARAIARLEKTDDRQLADETALLLLYTPGLRPYVPAWSFRDNWNVRYGGLTGLSSLRDNWWCRFDRVTGSYYTPHLKGVGAVPEPLDGLREATTPIDPVFLAPAERQRAADELAILMSRDSGSNELAQRVVGWARRNPQDPRAPEALHRVVRGVRVGCNNENSGTLAKAAFELLHTRYGKSPWAARTPYWYR
jgi:hypothetical protein